MKQIIEMYSCDRCGEKMSKGEYEYEEERNLKIMKSNSDNIAFCNTVFCDDCKLRFMKFWNRFMEPDITEFPQFKPNEEKMYTINDKLL